MCRRELVKSWVWLRVVGRELLGMGMVGCPFVGVLGRGGGGFPTDGRAGAGAVVSGVVAQLHLHVPLEVCMTYDFAGVKLDAVQG